MKIRGEIPMASKDDLSFSRSTETSSGMQCADLLKDIQKVLFFLIYKEN